MARKIISVPYKKVKKMLAEGMSNLRISQTLNLPESTVKKIKSGKVVRKTFRLKKPFGDELCSSCGIRPKEPGFRFLCRNCFRKAGNETVYSVNIQAVGVLTSGTQDHNLS
jgi:hypothetical protein